MRASDITRTLSVADWPDPEFEIRGRIIVLDPISMMDRLTTYEGPPQYLLHDDAVFGGSLAVMSDPCVSRLSDCAPTTENIGLATGTALLSPVAKPQWGIGSTKSLPSLIVDIAHTTGTMGGAATSNFAEAHGKGSFRANLQVYCTVKHGP